MVHIVEKTRSAAPARNYSVMKRGNLMKHVALYFSESVFTFFSENLPYRSVLPLFDDMVEVNKFEACSLGEACPKVVLPQAIYPIINNGFIKMIV